MSLHLKRLRGDTYYLPLQYSNAGLILTGDKTRCVLIDCGSSEDEAQAIAALLQQHSLTLESILLTHAHADNCGGAAILRKLTKALVFASADARPIVENPKKSRYVVYTGDWSDVPPVPTEIPEAPKPAEGEESEASALVEPLPELPKTSTGKFLVAKPCPVDGLLQSPKGYTASTGDKIGVLDLAGHSPGHVGFVSPDGVVFVGDALLTREELTHIVIPHLDNVEAFKRSLELLAHSKQDLYLPTHGAPLDFSVATEVFLNQQQIRLIEDSLVMHLQIPKTRDDLVALSLASFSLPANLPNFYRVTATINAFLMELRRLEKAMVVYEKGKARWFATE